MDDQGSLAALFPGGPACLPASDLGDALPAMIAAGWLDPWPDHPSGVAHVTLTPWGAARLGLRLDGPYPGRWIGVRDPHRPEPKARRVVTDPARSRWDWLIDHRDPAGFDDPPARPPPKPEVRELRRCLADGKRKVRSRRPGARRH